MDLESKKEKKISVDKSHQQYVQTKCNLCVCVRRTALCFLIFIHCVCCELIRVSVITLLHEPEPDCSSWLSSSSSSPMSMSGTSSSTSVPAGSSQYTHSCNYEKKKGQSSFVFLCKIKNMFCFSVQKWVFH